MGAYLARRIVVNLFVLWLISLVLFVVIHAAPGDPIRMMISPTDINSGTAALLQQRRHELGLDQPLVTQYFHWLGDALRGDLGDSFANGKPVSALVRERLGPTVLLMGLAMSLSLLLSVPAGVWAASRKNSGVDYGVTVASLSAVCIPPFFLGMIGIYVFSFKLGILPSAGMQNPRDPSTADSIRHLVMPVAILGFAGAGALTRYVRSSVISELRSDYVRTAEAKGASRTRVLFRHVLRNALIPVITIVALSMPSLLAGAVIIEQVFSWPGMGQLAVASVNRHDYPVIVAFALLVSVLVLVSNLLADMLYTIVDPRVTLA